MKSDTTFRVKSSFNFHLSRYLLLMLVACGPKASDTSMPLEHRVTTDEKSTIQKMRAQCYAAMPAEPQVKSDAKRVKVCAQAPDKTYNSDPTNRKFTFSRKATKDKNPSPQISVDIAASVVFPDQKLNTDQKKLIVDKINSQCLPNILTFWKTAADIDLTINNLKAFIADDGSASVDQSLYLTAMFASGDASTQASGTELNASVEIAQWPGGPVLQMTASKDCNDKASKATGIGAKDRVRNECAKLENQNFCLAVNKMIGHWLGAEDKTDLNCYDPPATTDKATTKTPTPIDTEAGKTSFMHVQTNPSKDKAIVPGSATTPDAAKTEDTTSKPQAPKADPSTPDTTSKPPTNPTSDATSNPTSNSKTPGKTDLTSEDFKTMAAAVDLETAASLASKISTDDPSYRPWDPYVVSSEDLTAIFDCDPKKAQQKAVVAAPQPQAPKKLPGQAPAPVQAPAPDPSKR